MALTDKERAEKRILDRKIMTARKVTSKELARAFDLKRKSDSAN